MVQFSILIYNTSTATRNRAIYIPNQKNIVSASLVGFLFNIKFNPSGSLIIGDRYFYDLYIDPKRYRLNLPKYVIKLCSFVIPSPDFVFLCVGEPDLIYKRKPEISTNEIMIQQNNLKDFAAGKKNCCLFNTTAHSPGALVSSIVKILDNK